MRASACVSSRRGPTCSSCAIGGSRRAAAAHHVKPLAGHVSAKREPVDAHSRATTETQPSSLDSPVALLHVPPGHGVGEVEP